jgi:hypothetical protein
MTGEEMLMLEFIRAGREGKRKYLECINFFEKLLGMFVNIPGLAARLQEQGHIQSTRMPEGYDVYQYIGNGTESADWELMEATVSDAGGRLKLLASFKELIHS